MNELDRFVKWIRKKRVTTTCYGGGNEFPRCLCYNYFSDFIVNIGLKMKVYDLSYSEYTERVAYLFLKSLNQEEENVKELYNLLTADGSDFFFHMSVIVSDIMGRRIDFMCYFLLLSVRVPTEISSKALNSAVEIAQKILGEMANEKRE